MLFLSFLHILIISLFFNCNHILQEPSRWGTSQKSTGTHEPAINKIILQPFIPYLNTICMKEEEEKIISYLLNPAQNALYQTFIWNILSYDADSKETILATYTQHRPLLKLQFEKTVQSKSVVK